MRTFLIYCLILAGILFVNKLKAQSNKAGQLYVDTTLGKDVKFFTQYPPQYKRNFSELVQANIKYPKDALKKEIDGTVRVGFVVEKNGKISNLRIVKSVYPSLDNEALRLVKLTDGNWNPGIISNDSIVRAYNVLAIKFAIAGKSKPAEELIEKNRSVSKSVANINRDNYYDFYTTGEAGITTNWLRDLEVVPIILEELLKTQYDVQDSVVYQLPDSSYILLNAYLKELNVGIVFNDGHYADIIRSQRILKDFYQKNIKFHGKLIKWGRYKSLPENILVLQETWYWYQYRQDKTSEGLLGRNKAIEILREDIRAFIKKEEERQRK